MKIFKRLISFALAMLLALPAFTIVSFSKEAEIMNQSPIGSKVLFDNHPYERDEVLVIGDEPFFYNGIQIRIDKVVDWYNFDDEKVKQLFKIAKDDGFTVANVQIRWMDVQQDEDFYATESGYIRGGDYANQVFNQDGLQTFYDATNESNQALIYVKYDISQWSKGDIEASRIRFYNRSDLAIGQYVTVYGLDDTSWSKDTLTWNNAPGHNGYEVLGEKLAETPDWDVISKANYYDFDVTDYVEKARKAGKKEVAFILQSSTPSENAPETPIVFDSYTDEDAPRIFMSSMEEYNWEYLDRIISYAEEYDIKMEVLWFATDTCSLSTDIRVPYYVLRNYQKQVYSDKTTPWLKKASKGGHITGLYQYLMCKNDLALRQQEYTTLKTVFDHIAEYNTNNGNKNIVIGCQVCNEPNVSRLHNSSVKENGVKLQNCQCDTCVTKKQNGNYSDQGFRDVVMFEYCNNLAKAVKKSDYPVWTRVNNVNGGDAWGVTYNENMRAQGGTDTDEGTYLDFIGLDPYGWGRSNLYNFGAGSYSTGQNIPMVMECGGEQSMSALLMLATVAGGAYYNIYDLCSPDGHHLYDRDLNPRVIAAGDKYLPEGGTYIEDLRAHNHWINKIAYELATKKPEKIGGKDLLFFNCEGSDASNISVTKQIGSMNVTYKSNLKYSAGIAVKKSENEIVLLSSKDTDATFTLTDIATMTESVEFGHYEGSVWVKDEGDVTYTTSGTSIVVTMPAFSAVKVKTTSPLPTPELFEAENYFDSEKITLSNTSASARNVDEATASGGRWISFDNMSSGVSATFKVTVPENYEYARIATVYKGKSSGRANFALSINGIKYSDTINATTSEGFYTTAFGPVIKLNTSGENTFTYTASSSGAVCIDAISIIPVNYSPIEFDGIQLINEDFSSCSDNFGFPSGASVSNGQLNITESMTNYSASYKSFDANVLNQSEVEVSFDWKTNLTSNGKKSGIEFRDMYGRLIFAIQSKTGTVLRHSTQGPDSDSTHSQYDWEPVWTELSMDRSKTYNIHFYADFISKTVTYEIVDKETGLIIVSVSNAPITASNLARMVGCNYYTNESGKSYVGTQNIDNFVVKGKEGKLVFPYKNKTVYSFGDSIVYGHKYSKASFVHFATQMNGMVLSYNGAVNGAKITNGDILNQVNSAPANAPDIVIFTGGINDAYSDVDMTEFKAQFDTLISTMKAKWSEAEIIYVAIHKTAARDTACQEDVYTIATDICKKYDVHVADLYNSDLDTTIKETRWTYSFDDLGSDNLPGNMGTISSEKFSSAYPSGTHPNFRAIEEFYVPCVTQALMDALYQFNATHSISNNVLTVNATADDEGFMLALYKGESLVSVHTFNRSVDVPIDATITHATVLKWKSNETLFPMAPKVILF